MSFFGGQPALLHLLSELVRLIFIHPAFWMTLAWTAQFSLSHWSFGGVFLVKLG